MNQRRRRAIGVLKNKFLCLFFKHTYFIRYGAVTNKRIKVTDAERTENLQQKMFIR